MMISFQEFLVFTTAAFAVIFALVYAYFYNAFKYWERRGVPTAKPSFPFGNAGPLLTMKKAMSENIASLYDNMKTPFFGIYIFTLPRLVIKDPELVKMILVKDFQHFQNRGTEIDPKKNPLSNHLFTLPGSEWKTLRNALSPAFSSGKLKMMMDTVTKCGENLRSYLIEKADNEEVLEFKDLTARYVTDIITSVAIGIDVNSIENSNNEFRNIGREIFHFPTFWDGFKNILFFVAPEYVRKFRIRLAKPEVYKFMNDVVEQTVSYREKNGVIRKDFMQLLIQLRNTGKIREDNDMKVQIQKLKQLSLEEIAAEVNLFFLAGFETSSITMSSFFYEMALHPDVMRKAQQEIDVCIAKHGNFSYEAMNEMKYLENCINETLRLYTVLPFLVRECVEDYKLPGYDTILPKGTRVLIPTTSLQSDPQYFPEPKKYDPDRFNEERRDNITPYTYLPFGEGPRICIGMRLAKMQVKLGVAMVLQKYDILKCSKTPEVIKPDPTAAGRVHLGGICLRIAHRK